MSEKVMRFFDVDWSRLLELGQTPIAFCIKNNISIYFKVDREKYLVHCDYWNRPELPDNVESDGGDTLPPPGLAWSTKEFVSSGFRDDLLFLRLENVALEEIGVSGHVKVSRFVGEGVAITREVDREQVENCEGEGGVKEGVHDINIAIIPFESAFLVDEDKWSSRSWNRPPWIPPLGTPSAPSAFMVPIDVAKDDLWISVKQVDELKARALKREELVVFPFEFKDDVPAVYWMFQAAYLSNEHGRLDDNQKIKEWLDNNAPTATYSYRSHRTAIKFIKLGLSRNKGGKPRAPFVMKSVLPKMNPDLYKFKFVSEGLSLILAIADWWSHKSSGEVGLFQQELLMTLDENGFDGLELGDLVYLISRTRIKLDYVKDYEAFRASSGRAERTIIDDQESLLRPLKGGVPERKSGSASPKG